MTREEMLKLAAEKGGSPQEIITFAKEMEAFLYPVKDHPMPAPVPYQPSLNMPEYRQSKVGNRLVSNAPRARQHWSQEEIEIVKQAMKENMPMAEISALVGRPVNGILKAMRTEKFK